MYDNILVGTDGSATATRALEEAARVAKTCEAKLHIMSAYHPSMRPEGVSMASREQADETTAPILEAGAELARGLGAEVDTHAASGDAGQALIKTAKDIDADLIVVGNRDLKAFRGLFGASISEKVAHHAPCAVLIVRTNGD